MLGSALTFALLLCLGDAYSVSRRQALVAASVAAIGGPPLAAQAVISSKYCAYGTGDGCEDLAEGNELIKQLQARSAANKDAIQQVRTLLTNHSMLQRTTTFLTLRFLIC